MYAIRKSVALATCAAMMMSNFVVAQDSPGFGERLDSGRTSAQEQRTKKEAMLPRCSEPVGSVAIATPDHNWWSQVQLQNPEALIKMFVSRSGCFTIVDRGRGAAIAERERALASSGNLQQGSNIGGGQMRAADYVITPDVVVSNNNSGGNVIGAILGAFIPGWGGVLAGGLRMTDQSANVTLAVTDVRTTEQLFVAEGNAQKTDIGFGVGGGAAFMGGGFGAAGAGSYENTALGQVISLAYLEAYSKMVGRIQSLRLVVRPVAEPAPPSVENVTVIEPQQPQQPTTVMKKPVATSQKGNLYKGPTEKSDSIRELLPGTVLYPTTNTSGIWWEVELADDSGTRGWIPARILQLGQ